MFKYKKYLDKTVPCNLLYSHSHNARCVFRKFHYLHKNHTHRCNARCKAHLHILQIGNYNFNKNNLKDNRKTNNSTSFDYELNVQYNEFKINPAKTIQLLGSVKKLDSLNGNTVKMDLLFKCMSLIRFFISFSNQVSASAVLEPG